MSVNPVSSVAATKLSSNYFSRSLIFRARQYLSSLLVVWLAIALYRYNPYYSTYLDHRTQAALLYLAIAYSLGAIFFYVLVPAGRLSENKASQGLHAVWHILAGIYSFMVSGPRDYHHKLVSLSKSERLALLFGLVKLFFIPLMINFLLGNYDSLRQNATNLGSLGNLFSIESFNAIIYPLLFAIFLTVDTAFFTFGYLFEAAFLGNRLRSVEPTAIGWAVALICYPPFNGLFGNYVSWYASDSPIASSANITFVVRLGVLLLMGIYASASVALGPKASNLTNRGIVGYGPYKFVRHPAYICKNLAWWVSMLPLLSFAGILSMGLWSGIYFMRAITEERHLSADPDYLAYCQKVRWRFIPGII